LIDPSHGSSLGFRLIEDNYRGLASPEPAIDIWRDENFSGRETKFLNYVQMFSTLSNTFFQAGEKS